MDSNFFTRSALLLVALSSAAPATTASASPPVQTVCSPDRLFFHGGCRTEAWFAINLAADDGAEVLSVMGPQGAGAASDYHGVVLLEKVSDSEYRHVAVTDVAPAPLGSVPIDVPHRGRYRVAGTNTSTFGWNADEHFVLSWQATAPTSVFVPGTGVVTTEEILDWGTTTYRSATTTEYCGPDGCYLRIAELGDGVFDQDDCNELAAGVASQAKTDCAIGIGVLSAVLGGGVATVAVISSGGLAVLGAGVAPGIAGGWVVLTGGIIAVVCDNESVQASIQYKIDEGCVTPPTGGPGGGGADPVEPGGFGGDEACIDCQEWEYRDLGYDYWDDATNTVIHEHDWQWVCTEYVSDPTGEDADGDGECD